MKARGYATVADYERKKAAKDEAEGRLERAKRALDLAHNQLAYAELKADADGVITATLAEPGQVVAIGQAVARLAHRGEMEAVVALPETWLGEARASQATVKLWAGPSSGFPRGCASCRRRPTPRPAPTRRASPSRIPTTTVALGMTATVTLSHAADVSVGEAPARGDPEPRHRPIGLCGRQVGCARAAAGDGCVLHRDVALVTSGVSDGDRVVTLGVQKLDAGEKVRAVEQP